MMRMVFIVLLVLFSLIFAQHALYQEYVPKAEQGPDQPSEIQIDSLSFLPQGTLIDKITKDKIYLFLPHNTEIQGILCRGDSHRGWETVLYINGKLAQAWLARTEEIQDVPCMKASFWTEVFGGSAAVYFHDNRKLAKCKLARDTTIDGHTFEKGDHIRFDKEGKVIVGN